jgi:hypothetical protein
MGSWKVRKPHGRARWSRAFSLDDGRSWQVNWIMEFTRREPAT